MTCNHGSVIWAEGLSGAGKSTLVNEVAARIREKNELVVQLNGDELSNVAGFDFSD